MFTVLPTPAFTFGLDAYPSPPPSVYRPAVPSPLSSSPLRASSTSPTLRDAGYSSPAAGPQSSPITARHEQNSRFKYASRNPRPNPIVKRREDAQEGRRRLFLQNVRQRTEDQKWERRGGGDELLKLEWWRLSREIQQAKESDAEGFIRIEDIEDEVASQPPPPSHSDEAIDMDSMMVDAMEQQEQAEIDALLALASQPTETASSRSRSESMYFSDDEDYDSIFMELISAKQSDQTMSEDVDMS